MSGPVFFDHVEVHVKDIPKYCDFLVKLFKGGRYKIISDSGSSMFVTASGLNVEVKKNKTDNIPTAAGFCNPCLRMEHAKSFIEDELLFEITQTVSNPEGNIYFFNDHEGVTWHIKEYLFQDETINW